MSRGDEWEHVEIEADVKPTKLRNGKSSQTGEKPSTIPQLSVSHSITAAH